MYDYDAKVVAIGGGTGLSTLLKGLKRYPIDITAIVTVADDGGSSKEFRETLKMPPPGDVRKVILSMSEVEPTMEKLFKHRFKGDNGLTGHPVGNIILGAMQEITGDFSNAVELLSEVLNVKGTVLPVSNEPLVLLADLEDGTTIEGESLIPKHDSNIKRVYFKNQDVKTSKKVVDAIMEADLITLGPGSLYTSVIPNLIVPEVKAALTKTKAKIVYVSNIMTQPGETTNYTVSDHINAIEAHLGARLVEYLIVNDQMEMEPRVVNKYIEQNSDIVIFDSEKLALLGKTVYTARLGKVNIAKETIRHNTNKLASQIFALLLDLQEE